ncbi:MAG TPA: hypothetical protein VK897_12545 [Anaerolineales bacterium]|nr:hypothetical protein [Anaerolineales bacterium]
MALLLDELLAYLFDGQPHLLTEEMKVWLSSSRRFMSFVEVSRDKIRKKLRVTKDPETVYDLRLELETAYLLLRERTLSLEYERPLGKEIRSPDFAVTFTTSLTFMVEVTRMRPVQQLVTAGDNTLSSVSERLADTICSKLGQLLPRHSNILIIGMDALHLTQSDLQAAMLRIQQRAERDDAAFWQRYHVRDRADFFRHYQRLTEVLLRGTQLQTSEPVVIWINPQAKHPLPSKVRTALHRSHTPRG